MTEPLNWRTSTYTKTDNCVEVADNDTAKVHVRDSKRRSGPEVTWSPDAWGAFIEHTRRIEV
ncbi:DUF397 domain-containing protein [Streptomyces sp. NPDC004111]|uniref:DUF397 domain-containing protein n=1 Tax=Streptomyces sp. NPDC004111 TaxID=3364690 RepID=UPI00369B5D79